MMFEPGQIVRIFGLKSAKGRELNYRRGIVLRRIPPSSPADESQPRCEILVEESTTVDEPNVTSAIKESNLRLEPKRPLPPSGGDHLRGFVSMDTVDESTTRTLVELLLRFTPEYSPSDTMFFGYASMAFQRLGQFNFRSCDCVQMEQIGGLAAIANICDQGKVCACENVMFALLEGDTMHLDVICILLYHTPWIGPEDVIENYIRPFERTPEQNLTPDQDTEEYCFFMEAAPLLLFSELASWHFSSAFFAAIRRTEFYPQVVQRLVRIIGREGITHPTKDGKRLGKLCRKILPALVGQGVFPDKQRLKSRPVSAEVAAGLLEHSSTLRSAEVIAQSLPGLFGQ